MENPVSAVKMDDLGVYPLKKRRKPPSGETCSSFELVVGAFPVFKNQESSPACTIEIWNHCDTCDFHHKIPALWKCHIDMENTQCLMGQSVDGPSIR